MLPETILILLAIAPILFLIIGLGVFKLPAHWTTLGALGLTALIAFFVFGQPLNNIATAGLEGAALALWPIMLVIIAAIFMYNLAVKSKSIETIKNMLTGVSVDRRIQVLIIAWGFGGFLEAVAGYGTAVAIPASIMMALGFEPVFAAVICLIANTVPTAFGGIGLPVSTLASPTVANLNENTLSLAVGIQLTPFIILVPLVLVMMTGVPDTRPGKPSGSLRYGPAALKGVIGITLLSGVAFAIPQLLAAAFLGAQLPALLGSIFALIVTILMAKLRKKQANEISQAPRVSFKEGIIAWLPYLLVLIIIIGTSKLFPGISDPLSHLKSSVTIYDGPGAKPVDFKWILTPGVLILIAAFIGGFIQRLSLLTMVKELGKTIKKLWKSTLTVVCILAISKVMDHGGMVQSIANALRSIFGNFYPLVAGFVGTLGTFITGSDTSSNILFGKLQTTIAGQIGSDPYWIAAANTAGATAGKMISPQSISVATSATGMVGKEGLILSKTIGFCLAYVLILGVFVFALNGVFVGVPR